ncbi:MAG: crossover junction endodeoxyribonuclease RuvC [Psittacicella sp.]
MSKIILGIDPGTNKTGYGVIKIDNNSFSYIASGIIRTNQKDDIPKKLATIHNCFLELLEIYSPDILSIEEAFTGVNIASSLKLSYVRGVILAQSSIHSLDIFQFPPRKVKKIITGAGDSSKEAVRNAVMSLLHLNNPPSLDASDALAISISAFLSLKC